MSQVKSASILIRRNSKLLKTSNPSMTSNPVTTSNTSMTSNPRTTSNIDKSGKDGTDFEGKGAKNIPKRDRYRIFIEEYVRTLNATQAALRAGYNPKSARTQGSTLLMKPDIRAEIEVALKQRLDNCRVDTEFILQQLKDISLNPRCPYKDRVKALDLLGSYLNMWSGEVKQQATNFTITLKEKPD